MVQELRATARPCRVGEWCDDEAPLAMTLRPGPSGAHGSDGDCARAWKTSPNSCCQIWPLEWLGPAGPTEPALGSTEPQSSALRLLSHRCLKVDIGRLLKHSEKRQCATWRLTSGALCSRYFMFCESSSGAPGPIALAESCRSHQVLIYILESIESTLVTTPFGNWQAAFCI